MSETKPPAEIPNGLSLRLRDLDTEMLYTLADYVKALADARTEADDRDDGETDGGEPARTASMTLSPQRR